MNAWAMSYNIYLHILDIQALTAHNLHMYKFRPFRKLITLLKSTLTVPNDSYRFLADLHLEGHV